MESTSRRNFLGSSALVGLGAIALSSCASETSSDMSEDTSAFTAASALAALIAGNERFVSMKQKDPNLSAKRRTAVSTGQDPFAAIVSCVDSRVPPELVFDRGLGDLFTARVAGAIGDDSAIGSIEFGVEEFGIPLVVVMGHTSCGAVTATVEALESGETEVPGSIGSITKSIAPSVEEVIAAGTPEDQIVEKSVWAVTRKTATALAASPVLVEQRDTNGLQVWAGVYDLQTGRVDFLQIA